MGFGKYLLGGVCAIGAVIAAPVAVPAAGLALATGTIAGTGVASAATFAAGVGMYTASSATVATVAGVAAGAAGMAAGAAEEKKRGEAYTKGCNDGYVRASKEYEEKLQKQYAEFMSQKKNLEKDLEEYEDLIDEYTKCIHQLKEDLFYERGNAETLKKELAERQRELARLRGLR